MFEYRAMLMKVVDGDTVDLSVDLGFRIYTKIRVRLAGIDTPEVRGPERPQGLDAKDYLKAVLGRNFAVEFGIVIRTNKTGKYGRWIADIFLPTDGLNTSDPTIRDSITVVQDQAMLHVNKLLVNSGHARRLDGC